MEIYFEKKDREFLEKVKEYAIKQHSNVNQYYDNNKPYSFHLNMVYNIAINYIHLISEKDRLNVLCSCFCHDLIEDARNSYNNVSINTNEEIANITYALTNEKGKNRKERANNKYYKGIRNTKYATFVKLCDRIANVEYSKNKGSSVFKKYKYENDDFIKQLNKKSFMDYILFFKKREIENYKEMITWLNLCCMDVFYGK